MNINSLSPRTRFYLLFAFGKTLAYIFGLYFFVDCMGGHVQANPTDPDKDCARGFLEVFSSTTPSQWGEGSFYFLHTGYQVYDSTGKAVKWVANHGDSADEAPEKVALEPGTYSIWAQSDRGGFVRRSVVVKALVTTTVHLDKAGLDKKSLAME